MKQVGEVFISLVNFGYSKQGLLTDVHYEIFNSDGSIYLSRRQDNVIEFGNGTYGVPLSFSNKGSFVIAWEIEGTSYTASEEIIVFDYKSDEMTDIKNDISFIRNIEGGRWKIENNQMIFYSEDNATEIARFNLFDDKGSPSNIHVFERMRV